MKHMYFKFLLLSSLIAFGSLPFADKQSAHAQVAVLDAADIIADALAMIEFLALNYVEYQEWEQMINEWEHYLETVRSLEERFPGLVASVAKDHARLWGDTPLTHIINFLDPLDPDFKEITVELMLDEMGVLVADDIYRETLLEHVKSSTQRKIWENRLISQEARDLTYRDNLHGASSTELRNDDRYFEMEGIADALQGLGENSDIATAQLNVASNLLISKFMADNIEMLSRLYAETGREGLYENAAQAQVIQSFLEMEKEQEDRRVQTYNFVDISPVQ